MSIGFATYCYVVFGIFNEIMLYVLLLCLFCIYVNITFIVLLLLLLFVLNIDMWFVVFDYFVYECISMVHSNTLK